MEKLFGTGVALVTPFERNGKIDYKGLANLLEFTASNGVDYYVVMGTTGEAATLTVRERMAVLSFVKENNPKKLPIVFGHGGNNTKEILEELKEFDLSGVDALLSISPYYNKPSQEGIYQHYLKLANASPVPIILYNVPTRTASNILASTTARLSNHENIIGIKEASGDISQYLKIIRDCTPGFMLISGDDLSTLSLMAIGGCGVISVMANSFGQIFRDMREAFIAGDTKKAARLAADLVELNPLMYEESNPVGIKIVLDLQNICAPHVRLPLFKGSKRLRKRIEKAYQGVSSEI